MPTILSNCRQGSVRGIPPVAVDLTMFVDGGSEVKHAAAYYQRVAMALLPQKFSCVVGSDWTMCNGGMHMRPEKVVLVSSLDSRSFTGANDQR